VGSLRTVHSDFRLVVATHKPLREMVADGSFRQDLFYRISAFPIRLPALRERSDDLPLLIDSLLQRIAPGAAPRPRGQAKARPAATAVRPPARMRSGAGSARTAAAQDQWQEF
jgi:transcriptional regulator with GAF, ATPase, and Fis domain